MCGSVRVTVPHYYRDAHTAPCRPSSRSQTHQVTEDLERAHVLFHDAAAEGEDHVAGGVRFENRLEKLTPAAVIGKEACGIDDIYPVGGGGDEKCAAQKA